MRAIEKKRETERWTYQIRRGDRKALKGKKEKERSNELKDQKGGVREKERFCIL